MVINFAYRSSSILYKFLVNSKITNWILPANICFIVPLVFKKAGKQIQFVDIDESNLIIDENILYKTIRNINKPIGLLLNHSYGIEYNFSKIILGIKDINNSNSIIVDKCLCKPELNVNIDANIDLILYSTGYAKYCNLGFGGYGYTHKQLENINFDFNKDTQNSLFDLIKTDISNNNVLNEHIDVYSNWLENTGLLIDVDLYFKQIEASIPLIVKHKEEINNIYIENLPTEIQFKPELQNWRFNIRTNKKEIILKELFKNNLFASNHYPDMSYYFNGLEANNVSKIQKKIINLFNDIYINSEQALQVTKIIKSYL